jgi:outer membrane protein OmpA-like peptidoglycan-associated protein
MPRKKEKVGAPPAWMTTMSDMNTLLMTFFVMLFAILSFQMKRMVEATGPTRESVNTDDKTKAQATPQVSTTEIIEKIQEMQQQQQQENVTTEVNLELEGVKVQLARGPEGVVLRVGGEFDPFDEGSYTLKPQHYRILDTIYQYLMTRSNHRVLVRGYTGRNYEDSLMLDEQGLWRAWTPNDPREKADWRELGYRRAREAEAYLVRMASPIAADRIKVQAEGAWGFRRARPMPPPIRLLEPGTGKTVPERVARAGDTELEKWRQEQSRDRRVDIVIVPGQD